MSEANCDTRAKQLIALREESETAAIPSQQARSRGAACEFAERRLGKTCRQFLLGAQNNLKSQI